MRSCLILSALSTVNINHVGLILEFWDSNGHPTQQKRGHVMTTIEKVIQKGIWYTLTLHWSLPSGGI